MDYKIRATNDIFFKYLLGREENTDLLISFINAVLQDTVYPQITTVKIENPFNLQDFYTEKLTILDIKASDASGRQFDIEVQTSPFSRLKERSLFYWAKLYYRQIQQSEDYRQLEPAISINLLGFALFPQIERYKTCFMLLETTEPVYALSDHLAIYFLELPKMQKDTPVLKLEEWMYYFRTEGDEKVKILLKNDPLFRKAHKDYIKFTEDDQLSALSISREKARRDHLTRLADAREEGLLEGVERGLLEGMEKGLSEGIEKGLSEGIEKGLSEGIEKGLSEGIERGREEVGLAIAREMKAGGEDPSKIAQYTGLSLEEIENL